MSNAGGLALSIFGIITFVLSSYQAFAFEKAAFDQLYMIDAADNQTHDSPRSKMLSTI